MKPLRSRDVDAPWPVLYGTAIIESIEIAFRGASIEETPVCKHLISSPIQFVTQFERRSRRRRFMRKRDARVINFYASF